MACACRSCDGWTQDMAEHWWKVHLPEYTGPLTLGVPRSTTATELVST
jgi:hypothetical protein